MENELMNIPEVNFSGTKMPEKYTFGRFSFSYTDALLSDEINIYHLTWREADLLRLLCFNLNKLVYRKQALNQIWGSDSYFLGRSMDVYITKLRKYLMTDNNISIKTIYGKGFQLEERKD
jgi:DNA-binding response OmpR family regulator